MHIPTTSALLPALLLLVNPVSSHPAPSPQFSGIPVGLQCKNGLTCPYSAMTMACRNDVLYCYASILSISIGKCTDCLGSVCATSADAYPGDSTPKPAGKQRAEPELTVEEKRDEVEPRQTFGPYCQAGWSCSCVAFDGKGYYTKGKGSLCPADQGAIESCTEENGFAVSSCKHAPTSPEGRIN